MSTDWNNYHNINVEPRSDLELLKSEGIDAQTIGTITLDPDIKIVSRGARSRAI